jgi:hypothetical protein
MTRREGYAGGSIDPGGAQTDGCSYRVETNSYGNTIGQSQITNT